nr:LYR motif containing protein 1 [Hymenolepis microstoma]CUU98208.1 hypothetical transcript [Hymenolepis microstoma]
MSASALLKTTQMTSLPQKTRVLDLYKRLMRLSKTWTSASGDAAQSAKEREYIKQEARTLFRSNAHLTDSKAIEAHILEGESRLELAIHYRNPYPRLSNLPKSSVANRYMKRNQRAFDESVPAYLRSYKTGKDKSSD